MGDMMVETAIQSLVIMHRCKEAEFHKKLFYQTISKLGLSEDLEFLSILEQKLLIYEQQKRNSGH